MVTEAIVRQNKGIESVNYLLKRRLRLSDPTQTRNGITRQREMNRIVMGADVPIRWALSVSLLSPSAFLRLIALGKVKDADQLKTEYENISKKVGNRALSGQIVEASDVPRGRGGSFVALTFNPELNAALMEDISEARHLAGLDEADFAEPHATLCGTPRDTAAKNICNSLNTGDIFPIDIDLAAAGPVERSFTFRRLTKSKWLILTQLVTFKD